MAKRAIRLVLIGAVGLAGLALGGCDYHHYSGGVSYGYLGHRSSSCEPHRDHSYGYRAGGRYSYGHSRHGSHYGGHRGHGHRHCD